MAKARYAEAEWLFRRALAIDETAFGSGLILRLRSLVMGAVGDTTPTDSRSRRNGASIAEAAGS